LRSVILQQIFVSSEFLFFFFLNVGNVNIWNLDNKRDAKQERQRDGDYALQRQQSSFNEQDVHCSRYFYASNLRRHLERKLISTVETHGILSRLPHSRSKEHARCWFRVQATINNATSTMLTNIAARRPSLKNDAVAAVAHGDLFEKARTERDPTTEKHAR